MVVLYLGPYRKGLYGRGLLVSTDQFGYASAAGRLKSDGIQTVCVSYVVMDCAF